jgi:hypothetical protein
MCPQVVRAPPLLAPVVVLALPPPLVGLSFLTPPPIFAARAPDLREDRRTRRSGNAEQRHQEHRPCRLHAFSVSLIAWSLSARPADMAAVLVAYGLVVKAVPVAGLVWPSGTMSA